MEKKSNKIVKTLSKPKVLVSVLSGGILAVMGVATYKAYTIGFEAGEDHMYDTIKSNSEKILHKAYSLGMDAYETALYKARPDLKETIENTEFTATVPDTAVNLIEGKLKIK